MSTPTVSIFIVLLFTALLSGFAASALSRRHRSPRTRFAAWGIAALIWLISAAPAWRALMPGNPLFRGEMNTMNDQINVPPEATGPVRLLVSGKLPEGGPESVVYTLTGTAEPVNGALERLHGYARVGRGGSSRTTRDHTSTFHDVTIPPGTATLQLKQVSGTLGSPLEVIGYRRTLSAGAWLALALCAAIGMAWFDAKLGVRSNAAVAAAIALVFGELVAAEATPSAALGPTLASLLLAGVIGGLGGSALSWLVRQWVRAPLSARRTNRSGRNIRA